MLKINEQITIEDSDIAISAIRAMGSGGQNVNKVSSAIHLRFDIAKSNLPEIYKSRLLALRDSRITKEGVLVIKAQSHRTQEKNRSEALERLKEIVFKVTLEKKSRKPTKPTFGAKMKRLDGKKRSGLTKRLRGKVKFE